MKKGFTLIELLAVIVILAIIAVIAVPIVLNIISETKKSASLRSAEFYLDAVEYAVARSTLNNIKVTSGTYPIMEDGNICLGTLTNNICSADILTVEVKGEMPTGGEVTITSGEASNCLLSYNDTTAVKNVDGEFVLTDIMKKGTIAYNIINKYGGLDKIKTFDTKFRITYSDFNEIWVDTSSTYTFGTGYKINEETGEVTITGNLVQATPEECKNGTKTCGKYFTDEILNGVNRILEVDDYSTLNGDYLWGNVYYVGNDMIKVQMDFGLFKTFDNYGYSYFFKYKDADNDNYVKFGKGIDESRKGIFMYLGEKNNIQEGEGRFESLNECEERRAEKIEMGAPAEDLGCSEYTGSYTMLWRIVRLNGDGSIRLAFEGLDYDAGHDARTGNIGESAFNPSGDSKYAGYTYLESGKLKDSTIKTYLDNWYTKNLEKYSKYIVDGQFCNDKTLGSLINGTQNYSFSNRYAAPTLICSNKEDLYSVDSKIGNGLLTKPIGLLSVDEVRLASCWGPDCSISSYLDGMSDDEWGSFYDFDSFWTMSPSSYLTNNTKTYIYYSESWSVGGSTTNVERAVRPVINLKADVKFTGTGTFNDPYVIITE